ncbi:hypothetical protein CABS01_15562, partial [Colletotrichum abscissum]|uniref:uncharacterized protein n=1 Tax=Colletotrichum abscissum TaxID=1671311 RepID=UPI0027D56621
PSNSFIGLFLFFILKKRIKKRKLIINYKKLNEIIKKNYYPLLLIAKLRNLFYRAN